MLGYLIDFCISHKLTFTVFAKEFMDWKSYYEGVFNMKLDWADPTLFSPEDCSYILLVTDDDPNFRNEWTDEFKNKIICIDHFTGKLRRNNVLVHINTRYSTKYNNIFWALPIYPVVKSSHEKKELLNNQSKINVVCIGFNSTPKSSENLKAIFNNFNDIDFHIINHYIYYSYKDVTNIKEYVDVSVKTMTDLLRNADYVLCLENNNQKDYIHDTMSAAIPLAFNFGCRLIMPSSWKNSYLLKSPIEYDYTSTHMTLVKEDTINSVFEERDRLLNYRNTVFKGIMKI